MLIARTFVLVFDLNFARFPQSIPTTHRTNYGQRRLQLLLQLWQPESIHLSERLFYSFFHSSCSTNIGSSLSEQVIATESILSIVTPDGKFIVKDSSL